jgi:hypothetical protein
MDDGNVADAIPKHLWIFWEDVSGADSMPQFQASCVRVRSYRASLRAARTRAPRAAVAVPQHGIALRLEGAALMAHAPRRRRSAQTPLGAPRATRGRRHAGPTAGTFGFGAARAPNIRSAWLSTASESGLELA